MSTSDRLSAALAERYTIERELGAGGMATVYLAEDLKHRRKVAVKVLRPELAAVIGAERFLAEIKTTANLQHPHILPLFDSGIADSFLFYVMPFVEGESLRDRLSREKQLPIADAVRIATEVASALDYAHRHGVIHRDIKPENILLHDGSALVADFGIALAASKAGTRMTETGMSLGTPHYMSPEQAMGERELDARSDVYALGSVTYEMLTGEPPFTRPTAQAIVAKVMTTEPADITTLRRTIPGYVADAVHTSLQKLPADRFPTAALFGEALAGKGAAAPSPIPPRKTAGTPARSSSSRRGIVAAAGVLIGVAGFLIGTSRNTGSSLNHVAFTQRSFANQAVFTARFSRDGESIVYSAALEGSTPAIYVIRSDYPEARAVTAPGTHLLAVSSQDELAVLVNAQYVEHRQFIGTLARMPLGGGAPREILAGVREADWLPGGSDPAIIHEADGKDRLEYPIGKVLYEAAGYLSDLRFSPDGNRIAFLEHPTRYDDRGGVAVVDLKGNHRILDEGYWGLEGVAWTPDGKTIVYSGAVDGGFYQVHSVGLGGGAHLVLPSAGTTTIQDISASGHWLLTRDDLFSRLMTKTTDSPNERDLSWLDNSSRPTLSADGKLLAFDNQGADAGSNYAAMIRKTDGSPAVRLGEGSASDLSSDKNWVVSIVQSSPQKLMLYPAGPGQARRLDHGELEAQTGARFLPDGKNLLLCGNEAGKTTRCYVRSLDQGPLHPVTPEGTQNPVISPNGRQVVVQSNVGFQLVSLEGGAPVPVAGLTKSDLVARWSPDGQSLWVYQPGEIPVRLEQLDLNTGKRTGLLSIQPANRTGLLRITEVTLADDPHTYAYMRDEYISHIFVVMGMR